MATILTDDFNSYNDGNLDGQGSWVFVAGTDYHTQVSATQVYEGAKAVHAPVGNNNTYKEGTGLTDGRVTVYGRPDATNKDNYFIIRETASNRIHLLFASDGNIKILNNDGSVTATIKTGYSSATWYCIEAEWHSSPAKECRGRVNGGTWSDWLATTWTTNVNRYAFFSGSTGGGIYWDYIAENPYAAGTNFQLNIGDTYKAVSAIQVNVGDSWKAITKGQVNLGDTWKSIF